MHNKSPLESKSTTPFSSLALVSPLQRHLDSARGSTFEWNLLKTLFFCTFLCPCFCLRSALLFFFPVLSIKVEVTTVELSQPFMKTETDGFQTGTNNLQNSILFPPWVSNTNHIPPTTILHHPPPKFNYIRDENGISSPIFFFFLHLGNFVKKGFLFVFYFSGIDRDPIFSWHSIKKNASFLVFTYWHKK